MVLKTQQQTYLPIFIKAIKEYEIRHDNGKIFLLSQDRFEKMFRLIHFLQASGWILVTDLLESQVYH